MLRGGGLAGHCSKQSRSGHRRAPPAPPPSGDPAPLQLLAAAREPGGAQRCPPRLVVILGPRVGGEASLRRQRAGGHKCRRRRAAAGSDGPPPARATQSPPARPQTLGWLGGTRKLARECSAVPAGRPQRCGAGRLASWLCASCPMPAAAREATQQLQTPPAPCGSEASLVLSSHSEAACQAIPPPVAIEIHPSVSRHQRAGAATARWRAAGSRQAGTHQLDVHCCCRGIAADMPCLSARVRHGPCTTLGTTRAERGAAAGRPLAKHEQLLHQEKVAQALLPRAPSPSQCVETLPPADT